jgi:endoglucanase
MLAGHCDEIGFVVTHITDKGSLHFMKVGGISPKIAPGMCVEILGYGGTIGGVIGTPAEHHGGLKDGFGIDELVIDCGATSKDEMGRLVRPGDYVVYKRDTIRPSMAIACDVTFATDAAGVDPAKHGEIYLDKGPVLARGAPINPKINALLEASAQEMKMAVQYELTPAHTGTDADKVRLTGSGVPTALVSLPLRYMHSPVEPTSSFLDSDQLHDPPKGAILSLLAINFCEEP